MKKLLKYRESMLILLILVFFFLMSAFVPRFMTFDNVKNILSDTALLIMVACGQFLVILSSGIDLSVGSTIAFSGMAASMLNMSFPGLSPLICLLVGTLVGMVLGMINGAIVAYGKVPPIITTLGTMSIYRGATFVLSKGQWVTAHEMTQGYMNLPHGHFLGINNLIWFALVVSLIFFYFIRYTRTGREIYAIGGNKTAAILVGVKETKINFIIFTISGMVSGLAGVLWAARYAAAVNEMATGFELQTVASCVLGGVSVAGGSGTVPGVLLGALFLGILNNAMTMIKNMAFYQTFTQGFILLLAIVINVLVAKRNEKKLLNGRLR